MAKLHCCLAGFDADGASQVENLAGLVQPHLSAEWSFGAEDAEPCSLMLCDLGSAPGAAAWQESGHRSGPRAALTNDALEGGGLTLATPLRVHGPGGLVHLLNEAARLGAALAGPSQPPARPATGEGAPSAPGRGGLRSLLRAIPRWLPFPSAREPSPPPVHAAEPLPDIGVPANASKPPPRAGGVQDESAATSFDAAADAAPCLERGTVTAGAVGFLERNPPTRRPPPGIPGNAATLDAMGCDLLGLLRRAKTASQVIVVRLDGIPAICAAPTTGMAYTFATLQAVYVCPLMALSPPSFTVAQNSYHGRTEVLPDKDGPPVSVPALPLKKLLWVATLRCGGADEAAPFRDGTFKLLAWPDLASLPHARHHVTWCGMLARRPTTAGMLSEATAHDAEEAAVFMAACHELGVIQRKQDAASPALGQPAPVHRTLERATIFRSILNRLGLQRP